MESLCFVPLLHLYFALITEIIKNTVNNVPVLVSIGCFAYNNINNIRKCLDGFVMQKGDFLIEILIHDDASTDGTADVIREYENKYPEIFKPIYQTENQFSKGISITKEYILPRVQGKYLVLCDGDDYWIDNCYLKNGVMFLENNKEYNCYVTDSIYKTSDFQKSGMEWHNVCIEKVGHDISFDNFVYFHTSARLYRSEFDGYLNCPYSGEIYLYFSFLDKGKAYFDHKITSVYNISGTGTWTKFNQKEKEKRRFKVWVKANEYFSNKYFRFFWSTLPKPKNLIVLGKIIGIKQTMKLLSFLYVDKKYKKTKVK